MKCIYFYSIGICIGALFFFFTSSLVWTVYGIDGDGNGYEDITTGTELSNIRNNLSGRYELLNDIDLNNEAWIPLGLSEGSGSARIISIVKFTGELKGNGHAIRNIHVNRTHNYAGLFADINGRIENLNIHGSVHAINMSGLLSAKMSGGTIESVKTSGQVSVRESLVGGIIGYIISGNVSNSINEASVTGATSGRMYGAGGITAVLDNGSITRSSSSGAVIGNHFVGGIVGSNWGDIFEVRVSGSVRGYGIRTGGIAGENNDDISSAIRISSTTEGNDRVGGITGENYGTIANSQNSSLVRGNTFVGAVVGIQQYGSITQTVTHTPSALVYKNNVLVEQYDGEKIFSQNVSLFISGTVRYYTHSAHTPKHIPNATVTISSDNGGTCTTSTTTTNAQGEYSFINCTNNKNYSLSVSYTDTTTQGITHTDRGKILKHTNASSIFARIASDTNRDGLLTTTDQSKITRLVNGLDTNQWLFYHTTPTAINEAHQNKTLTNISSDQTVDFVGVKLGDSNGDW